MDSKFYKKPEIRFQIEEDGPKIFVENNCEPYFFVGNKAPVLNLPTKKIINKDACILFFGENKYIVKRMPTDTPDPEKAFLLAYFLAKSGLSRTKANKYLDKIREEYNPISKKDIVKNNHKRVRNIKVQKG